MSSEPVHESAGLGAADRGEQPLVVLSQEVLRIGPQVRESGRIRVSKRIVEETVTQTVVLRREELVVERLDVGTDPRPGVDPLPRNPFDDSELEVILHAEEAVITTQIVPVERVRLSTSTVTEQVNVTDSVRGEHADLVSTGHDAFTSQATSH